MVDRWQVLLSVRTYMDNVCMLRLAITRRRFIVNLTIDSTASKGGCLLC